MSDIEGRCFTRVSENTLVATDFVAQEWLQDLTPIGGMAIINGRKPRNPGQHKWFFVMLKVVCDATHRWENPDEFRQALHMEVGHVRLVEELDGTIRRHPRSISYAAMGQEKFARFVKRCLYVINVHLGIDPEELMREVKEKGGGDLPLVRGIQIVPDMAPEVLTSEEEEEN